MSFMGQREKILYIKDFEGWNTLKQGIEKDSKIPTFTDREIWWCSIGINVGHEIDGKNSFYNRPVLVVRKFSPRLFWGVPLTTQMKDNPYYFPIDFKGKDEVAQARCVMLSHLRLYDSKRLHDMMGKLSPRQFRAVRAALKALL